MIELNGKNIVIELLAERILAGREVSSKFTVHSINPPEALEKFKRWKLRANRIIKQYISDFEASSFWVLPTNCIYLFATNIYVANLALPQIVTHIEFLNTLIEDVDSNHVYINKTEVNKWGYYILAKLQTMSGLLGFFHNLHDVADSLSISIFELELYVKQLQEKELVDWYPNSYQIKITNEGSKEVLIYLANIRKEKLLADKEKNKMQQTYRDKEHAVLKHIVEQGNDIDHNEIAKYVGLDQEEVQDMLFDFNRKGWVHLTFKTVSPTTEGKIKLKTWNEQPQVGNIYNTYFQGGSNNALIGGAGNTQNIQINNPNFDEAINGLLALIKDADIDDDDKEAMVNDVNAINKFAQKEPNEGLIEKFNARVKLLETGLKATELIGKAASYLPAIYFYFENLKK